VPGSYLSLVDMIGLIVFLIILGLLAKRFTKKTNAQAITPLFFAQKNVQHKLRDFANTHHTKVVEVRGLNLVLLTHPESVGELVKADNYDFVKAEQWRPDTPIGRLLQGTLITAHDTVWKKLRMSLSPAFQFEHIQALVPIIAREAQVFVNGLQSDVALNVLPWFKALTMEILVICLFGLEKEEMRRIAPNLDELYLEFLKGSLALIPIIFPFITKLPIPSQLKLKRQVVQIEEFTTNIIKEKQRKIAEGETRPDLLSTIINSTNLDAHVLQNNAFSFVAAGHETTSQALSWCLYYLVKYPHFQQQIYEEIVKEIGEKEDPVFETLKKLSFLDMFIKEVLRVRPPVPWALQRRTTKDLTISGHFVPAGFNVFACVDTLHFSEEFWDEPAKFDPHRFSPEKLANQTPYTYIPFFSGRHICIGMNFAQLEMRVVLVKILQAFSIQYIEEPALSPYSWLSPPESLKVALQYRTPSAKGSSS